MVVTTTRKGGEDGEMEQGKVDQEIREVKESRKKIFI